MEVRVARGVFAGMVSGAVVGGLGGLATLSVVNGPVATVAPAGEEITEITEAPIVAPQMEAEEIALATEGGTAPVAETAPEPISESMPEPDLEAEPGPDMAFDSDDDADLAPPVDPDADGDAASDVLPATEAEAEAPSIPPDVPAEPEMSDVQPEADQALERPPPAPRRSPMRA